MRTSLLNRISMALIFAFAALNVYAGINSGDEPYEFEEGLSDGGTYYYRTKDLEFKASNTEEIVLGGLQLLYKKGIYPVISIRIAGFEQSLIDLGKNTQIRRQGYDKPNTDADAYKRRSDKYIRGRSV